MSYGVQRKLFNVKTFLTFLKFREYDKAANKKREQIRNKNLHKMIEEAYKIPFYRRRFDEAGITPADIRTREDLTKLPVLTKEEYRQWMLEEIDKEENRACMIMETSGSSGKPLEVLNTPFEYAKDVANILRSWLVCGANPFWLKTITEADDSSETVGYKTFIQKLGILRREIINENDDEQNIINFINEYKPNILRMYKSELVRVGIYAKKKHIKMHKPDYYVVLGENVDEVSERVLREMYGKGLINLYGCVEAGGIAVRRPGNNYYEVFEDAVALNIYDENNKLSDKGRVIMSTLYKNKFPLINYDLKDMAEVEKTDRGLVIKEILGRTDDDVVYSDGTSTGWIRLWHIACEQQDLLQIHMIQKSYSSIVIQLVKDDASSKSEKQIEEELTKELNTEFKGRLEIEYQWLDTIPTDENGKTKLIEKVFKVE